jgi:hypothetical protein
MPFKPCREIQDSFRRIMLGPLPRLLFPDMQFVANWPDVSDLKQPETAT